MSEGYEVPTELPGSTGFTNGIIPNTLYKLKIRKSVEYHGHRVSTMMGWRSRITIMYLLYGMHNYKTILVLLRKLKRDKSSTWSGRREPDDEHSPAS